MTPHYNHQAKIEHNHLLKEEPAIIQKEMMKEDSEKRKKLIKEIEKAIVEALL